MDVPPVRTAVGDVPRNAEDASRDMSQPVSIEQDPIAQDQNQHIQQEDVDISQLYAKGNSEFCFANLQSGGDECESDDALSNSDGEYYSEDDGDAFSDASMDEEDEDIWNREGDDTDAEEENDDCGHGEVEDPGELQEESQCIHDRDTASGEEAEVEIGVPKNRNDHED